MTRGLTEADPIFYALGGRGRYQLAQFFIVYFATFSTDIQLLNFVFVGRSIPHTCTAPDNLTDIFDVINDNKFSSNTSSVEFEKCNIVVTNNISGTPETASLDCIYGYTYAERKDLSIMSDMDVVCDKAALKGLGQTLLILGQGLGAISLPVLSDRYGRRPVLLISHLLMLILGIVIAFSPSYLVFLIPGSVSALHSRWGVLLTMSTYGAEMFPAKHRRIISIMGNFILTVAYMMISLVAYLGRDISWRNLQLAYTSFSLHVLIQFFTMDESLRWLTAKGEDKKVVKLLKKAALQSGKKTEDVLQVYQNLKMEGEKMDEHKETEAVLLQTEEPRNTNDDVQYNVEGQKLVFSTLEDQKDTDTQKSTVAKSSFLNLMRTKRLALNVAVLWFIWTVDSMTFFGMYMTLHSLAGNRFVNFFLFALVEAPAAVAVFLLVDRFGRLKASTTLHSVAGISLIAATVVNHVGGGSNPSDTVVTVLSCIGVFGTSGAWGTSFFITLEMFPTNLRNFGIGTCSSFARIGGMLAPYAALLADYVPWAPGAIFGTCCMMVTVMVHVLPETMGRELPQTLQDLQGWYRKEGTKMENETRTAKQRKPRQAT